MRLKQNEIKIINKTILNIFQESKIYLFGSRIDDTKKGGDIDIFVLPLNRNNLFEKKIKTIAKLKNQLHKPIDIVVHKDFNRLIEQEAQKGILLNTIN